MTKFTKIIFPLIIFAFIILLLASPAKYSAVALDGALVWSTILLPTLFPFMFFSKLFISFDVTNNLAKSFEKFSNKVYRCPSQSIYVFLLSLLCGYPIGAKLITDLYLEGKISKGQAHRSASFVSNCGPMFIVGSVGAGMLSSAKAGIIIYLCHICSSLINGLLYRNCWSEFDNIRLPANSSQNNNSSTSDIIFSSINSILMVGAYVIIFFIVAEVFCSLRIFYPIEILFEKMGVSQNITNGFLCGFLEITKGAKSVAAATYNLKVSVPIICFIVTFSGFSTFMQSYAFLEKIGMKKGALFLQKITQALIASALCVIISLIVF